MPNAKNAKATFSQKKNAKATVMKEKCKDEGTK
jgi:hypothetical protein